MRPDVNPVGGPRSDACGADVADSVAHPIFSWHPVYASAPRAPVQPDVRGHHVNTVHLSVALGRGGRVLGCVPDPPHNPPPPPLAPHRHSLQHASADGVLATGPSAVSTSPS